MVLSAFFMVSDLTRTIFIGSFMAIIVVWLACGAIMKVMMFREDLLIKRAERKQSEFTCVTAPAGHQMMIRETNKSVIWNPAHLIPNHYRNGVQAEPSQLEIVTWQAWNALHGTKAKTVGPEEMKASEMVIEWPDKVTLDELLSAGGSTLSNIVLGMTMDGDSPKTISAPLESLVHIALAGSSGWGKSGLIKVLAYQLVSAPEPVELVLIKVLAYQLVSAPEPVELVFIDMEGVTFGAFAQSAKLRYPIVDDKRDIVAVLNAMVDEIEVRKKLFQHFPSVDKLSEYNRLAADPLPPIACLVDEAGSLLADRGVEDALMPVALRGRKYGIYLLLASQDFTHNTMKTALRNQLSTRIQLKAMNASQSNILLGQPDAKGIEKVGRSYVILTGQQMVEMQTNRE
jgi:hypothetical protein